MRKQPLLALLGALSLTLLFAVAPPIALADSASDQNLAISILDRAGFDKGVCAVLGAADTTLALELADPNGFLVHVLDPSLEAVEQAQEQADVDDRYGRSLVVERRATGRLPYIDNILDLVLASHLAPDALNAESPTEILRVLRPEGIAILGQRKGVQPALTTNDLNAWAKSAGVESPEVTEDEFGTWIQLTKPAPSGMDEWTHWEHRPDNNPVSTDQVIKAPYMTQFLGPPYYIAMPAISVAAGGRIFTAMGHIAHHRREEPWLNTLVACNGYNGTMLWTKKLPDGYLVHRSAMIATADTLYLIHPDDGEGVVLLDPETGLEKDRVRFTRPRGEWKWIAIEGDVLYGLVGKKEDPKETTILRSEFTHWSWAGLSKGYYEETHPWGFGNDLVAYDLKQRKALWAHHEEGLIDSRGLAIGGGRLYFYCPDTHIGCLDAASGQTVWINPDPKIRELVEEPGVGLTSTPGFKTSCFALYTPEVLFYEGQTLMNVVAVSTKDGSLLWTLPKTSSNPNMMFLDGKLLVGIGEEGSTLVVEPLTGKILEDLGFAKRSCSRLTATPDSLFCRANPEGFTRFDRATKDILLNGAMRPACNDGAIGANGLLYTGPWLCDCNLSLMGRVVLRSDGGFNFKLPEDLSGRLETFADIDPDATIVSSPDDWATYRGSKARSASTAAEIGASVARIWTHKPSQPVKLTPPVIAGDLLVVGGEDGKVRGIQASTGSPKWTHRTAGPILQAPSVWNGRVYVGSGDGYAYCLEAATGKPLWRFRGAPVEDRTLIYGSIGSLWPINTGVLVEDGVAYFAAGIIDYDGTYVYALDAVTGKPLWANDSSGHLDPKIRKGVSAQGHLTALDGKLWMPGGNVISPAAYDLKTGQLVGANAGDGTPKANRGEEIGILDEKHLLLGGKLLYSARENVVDPGEFLAIPLDHPESGSGKSLARGKIAPAWNQDWFVFVNGRHTLPTCWSRESLSNYLAAESSATTPSPAVVWTATGLSGFDTVSLALAENAVLAVCEIPNSANLEPTWSLCALNPTNGGVLWRQMLGGAATPNSLAVDPSGRIVILREDGVLECYGSGEAFRAYVASLGELAKAGGKDRETALAGLNEAIQSGLDPETRKMVLSLFDQLGVKVNQTALESGCLVDWKVAGPFPYDALNPSDAVFINAPNLDVSGPYRIGESTHEWREVITGDPKGKVDLERMYGPLAQVAVYAYSEVTLDQDQDLLLKVGSNDGVIVWFNGEEVGRHEAGRGWRPDDDSYAVRGKKGVNKVVLKVLQLGNLWAFSARLTDPANEPVNLARE